METGDRKQLNPILNRMKINNFPRYIFWSYSPDADLEPQTVARQVFQYGEIADIRRVIQMIPEKEIRHTLYYLKKDPRLKKRTQLIEKILLKKC